MEIIYFGLQTQHIPYPKAQGPPRIPRLMTHSFSGKHIPYSPDVAAHKPLFH